MLEEEETFFSFMDGMSDLMNEAIDHRTNRESKKAKHHREVREPGIQQWLEYWMERIETDEPPYVHCFDASQAFCRLERLARRYSPVQSHVNRLGGGPFPWPWTFPPEALDSFARHSWIQFVKNFFMIDFLSTHRWEHVCRMIRKTMRSDLEKCFQPMLPTPIHMFAWRQLLKQFEYNQEDKRYGPLVCVVTDGHLETRDQRNSPASK